MSKPVHIATLGKWARRHWLFLWVSAVFLWLVAFPHEPSTRQLAIKTVTQAQLNALHVALNLYLYNQGSLPVSLEPLYTPGGILLGSDHLTEKDLRLDAWKHPIVYSLGDDGSATVMSYGADGQPGGEHYDQDLVVRVLPKPAATRPATQSVSSQPSTMTGE
jgi:hypothetical protein